MVKNLPAKAGDRGLIPPLGRSPEKEMAILFSILAWEIPRTEEPGELQSKELEMTQRLNNKNKCNSYIAYEFALRNI